MKKITKLMCGVCGALGLTLALTGCATVGTIKNEKEEIIYNGNSAVMVADHLYFANAYTDVNFNDTGDYRAAAKLSYMARLNTAVDLAAKGQDYSPAQVEKVNSEVNGHAKAFTFALGNYIYYATPNKEEAVSEGTSGHYFNHTTLYRSKLNGDGLKKIYSTTGEVTKIEALKFDGQYYIVMLAGEKLIKIEIGKSVGSAQVLADGVKSIAIPKTYQETNKATSLDWNGDIYFTTDRDGDENVTGSVLKKIAVDGKSGDEKTVYSSIGQTITLSGREKNVVLYTLSQTGREPELFKLDTNAIAGQQVVLGNAEDKVFSTSSITNLNLIATSAKAYGYVFTSANGKLVVAPNDDSAFAISLKYGETTIDTYQILTVKDRTIYLSTTDAIYAADLASAFKDGAKTIECRQIVTMETGTISDKALYAFDGEYIYFYAKLQIIETEEEAEESEEEEETDDNLYMYRAKVGGSGENNYELLSKTQIKSRHSEK